MPWSVWKSPWHTRGRLRTQTAEGTNILCEVSTLWALLEGSPRPPPQPLCTGGSWPPFPFCGFPTFMSLSLCNLLQDTWQSPVGLPPRPGCWLLAVPAASLGLQPLQLLGHPGVLQGGPAHPPSKPAVTEWALDRRVGSYRCKGPLRRAERRRLSDTCPGPGVMSGGRFKHLASLALTLVKLPSLMGHDSDLQSQAGGKNNGCL